MTDSGAVQTRTTTGLQQAHRDSVIIDTASVTKFLIDLLGGALVAETCDVEPSTISRWAAADAKPNISNERRLRAAYQVARLLLNVDSDYTVRAWFIGMNPLLDDATPSEALADGRFREVLSAGRLFAEM